MDSKCYTRNPLVRDGTNQAQRILETLLPAYVSVDERSMKDLTEFAFKFAKEIQFYDADNNVDDDWQPFFDLTSDWASFSLEDFLEELKVDQQTKPHLALFFGFLYIFKIAQDDMNTITQRHLDFYYRDVLKLVENPAIPDQVALIFTVAKHVNAHLVKAGTSLKAGKDVNGVPLIYKVEKDVAINKAIIDDLRSVYVDRPTESLPVRDHRIYASQIANSSDGQGAALENEELSWETFGKDDPLTRRPFGQIGFAIASPLLFLAEGERRVQIIFDLSKVAKNVTFASGDIKVYFSGEKEWLLSTAWSDSNGIKTKLEKSTKRLVINRMLGPGDDAVVAYNADTLTDPFPNRWPVVKVVINQGGSKPNIYRLLKSLTPYQVTVKVQVSGVRDLVLQNDQAVLDASKPFQPFGNRPHLGSNFYIGSSEVFQKELTDLQVALKWKDLPDSTQGFKDYYKHYIDSSNGSARSNDRFKIDIKVLEKKEWKNVVLNRPLFTDKNGNGVGGNSKLPGPDADSSIIDLDSISGKISSDASLLPFQSLTTDTTKGFIRLILKGQDFAHKSFGNSYAKQAIKLANSENTDEGEDLDFVLKADVGNKVGNKFTSKAASEPVLPNEPYTPFIETLSLNYSAQITINIKDEEANIFEEGINQYHYVHPFGSNRLDTTGVHQFFPASIDNPIPPNNILPQYDYEGNLYLGITNLIPPQTLSVLFQHAEGSANPQANKQTVVWSFLKHNYWIDLDPDSQILSDSTGGLLNSGIIQFDIPKDITSDNTILPTGKYWIRAVVSEQADAVCDLIEVKAQAVMAVFYNQDNDADHLRSPLVSGTISKLTQSDSLIDKISQPFASFGGQVTEEGPDFYTRVSERLRHKHRAITIWDYEHLILQKFPQVFKIKCINHTFFDGDLSTYSEMSPGNVTIVVISNVFNKNAIDPLRPMTSLADLSKIEKYITRLNPPCAEIHVTNPIYEEISVEMEVKFHPGIDAGLHAVRLNQEIKNFLSPWASECPEDIRFGGRIHKSMILNYVEERSYVDYVTCFKMYHIIPDDPENNPSKDVDEAAASRAITILGSANNHKVHIISPDIDGCVCADNEVVSNTKMASVDDCCSSLSDEDILIQNLFN